MKRMSIVFVIMLFAVIVDAQITTTLNLQARPTPVLSEWANKNQVINFIVDKISPNPQQAIIKVEIKLSDGTVIGVTDITKTTPVTISRGVKIYYSKDVMPLALMIFSGTYRNSFTRTGKLPAGNYQLCISLLDLATLQPLVTTKCKVFFVASVQLPFLVMPANNTVLNKTTAQTAITFRWTPMSPADQTGQPVYRLQLFEVLAYQEPLQALRGNQPILDVRLRGVTQYIWRPGLIFHTNDSLAVKYIWIIQTLDSNGLPVSQTDGNGESRSEPLVFTIQEAAIKNRKQE